MATAEGRQVSDQQRDRLQRTAQNDEDTVADIVRFEVAATGVDERTAALANVAALITSGIPDPANYIVHVTRALDAGCSADEIVGTLFAITPNIGAMKTVMAAPLLAAALGIDTDSGDTQRSGSGSGGSGSSGGSGGGGGGSRT
jgi:4-carboxymuconolactone decarboxylase